MGIRPDDVQYIKGLINKNYGFKYPKFKRIMQQE